MLPQLTFLPTQLGCAWTLNSRPMDIAKNNLSDSQGILSSIAHALLLAKLFA